MPRLESEFEESVGEREKKKKKKKMKKSWQPLKINRPPKDIINNRPILGQNSTKAGTCFVFYFDPYFDKCRVFKLVLSDLEV